MGIRGLGWPAQNYQLRGQNEAKVICRILVRSTGLVPVAGPIDWLTGRRRKKILLRRARPSGKHDSFGWRREEAGQSCVRPGQARHGGEVWFKSPFSLSISDRRGQAPDVAEQNSIKEVASRKRIGQSRTNANGRFGPKPETPVTAYQIGSVCD